MNLLDFESKFSFEIENVGDCDGGIYDITITRQTLDNYGNDVHITEKLQIHHSSLDEIALGLEIMAKKIRSYMEY